MAADREWEWQQRDRERDRERGRVRPTSSSSYSHNSYDSPGYAPAAAWDYDAHAREYGLPLPPRHYDYRHAERHSDRDRDRDRERNRRPAPALSSRLSLSYDDDAGVASRQPPPPPSSEQELTPPPPPGPPPPRTTSSSSSSSHQPSAAKRRRTASPDSMDSRGTARPLSAATNTTQSYGQRVRCATSTLASHRQLSRSHTREEGERSSEDDGDGSGGGGGADGGGGNGRNADRGGRDGARAAPASPPQPRPPPPRLRLQRNDRLDDVMAEFDSTTRGRRIEPQPTKPQMDSHVTALMEAVEQQIAAEAALTAARSVLDESLEWIQDNPQDRHHFETSERAKLEAGIADAEQAHRLARKDVAAKIHNLLDVLMDYTLKTSKSAFQGAQLGSLKKMALVGSLEQAEFRSNFRSIRDALQDAGVVAQSGDDRGSKTRTASPIQSRISTRGGGEGGDVGMPTHGSDDAEMATRDGDGAGMPMRDVDRRERRRQRRLSWAAAAAAADDDDDDDDDFEVVQATEAPPSTTSAPATNASSAAVAAGASADAAAASSSAAAAPASFPRQSLAASMHERIAELHETIDARIEELRDAFSQQLSQHVRDEVHEIVARNRRKRLEKRAREGAEGAEGAAEEEEEGAATAAAAGNNGDGRDGRDDRGDMRVDADNGDEEMRDDAAGGQQDMRGGATGGQQEGQPDQGGQRIATRQQPQVSSTGNASHSHDDGPTAQPPQADAPVDIDAPLSAPAPASPSLTIPLSIPREIQTVLRAMQTELQQRVDAVRSVFESAHKRESDDLEHRIKTSFDLVGDQFATTDAARQSDHDQLTARMQHLERENERIKTALRTAMEERRFLHTELQDHKQQLQASSQLQNALVQDVQSLSRVVNTLMDARQQQQQQQQQQGDAASEWRPTGQAARQLEQAMLQRAQQQQQQRQRGQSPQQQLQQRQQQASNSQQQIGQQQIGQQHSQQAPLSQQHQQLPRPLQPQTQPPPRSGPSSHQTTLQFGQQPPRPPQQQQRPAPPQQQPPPRPPASQPQQGVWNANNTPIALPPARFPPAPATVSEVAQPAPTTAPSVSPQHPQPAQFPRPTNNSGDARNGSAPSSAPRRLSVGPGSPESPIDVDAAINDAAHQAGLVPDGGRLKLTREQLQQLLAALHHNRPPPTELLQDAELKKRMLAFFEQEAVKRRMREYPRNMPQQQQQQQQRPQQEAHLDAATFEQARRDFMAVSRARSQSAGHAHAHAHAHPAPSSSVQQQQQQQRPNSSSPVHTRPAHQPSGQQPQSDDGGTSARTTLVEEIDAIIEPLIAQPQPTLPLTSVYPPGSASWPPPPPIGGGPTPAETVRQRKLLVDSLAALTPAERQLVVAQFEKSTPSTSDDPAIVANIKFMRRVLGIDGGSKAAKAAANAATDVNADVNGRNSPTNGRRDAGGESADEEAEIDELISTPPPPATTAAAAEAADSNGSAGNGDATTRGSVSMDVASD